MASATKEQQVRSRHFPRMPPTEQNDLFAAVDDNPPDLDPNTTIAALAEEAAHCTRCHLYKDATQTVFGAGPPDARVLMVGEQPVIRKTSPVHPS
jgi:hypothetical protein